MSPFSVEDLEGILPPDPHEGHRRSRAETNGAGRRLPKGLPPRVARLLAEDPGEDRSDQTYRLVLTGLEEGLTDEQILTAARDHRPSMDKYGERLEIEVNKN